MKSKNYQTILALKIVFYFFTLLITDVVFASPKVVTFILPVQSLASGVMAGIGKPELAIGGGGSPHHHTLRPSEAKKIYEADLLVWVGPTLESFLVKVINNKDLKAKILTITEIKEVDWIRTVDDHGEVHGSVNTNLSGEPEINPHFWLDPQISQIFVTKLAEVLSNIDPVNSTHYSLNAKNLNKKLNELEANLRKNFIAIKNIPYISFHDAYTYLERRFELAGQGSVTFSAERMPGIRKVVELRKKIKDNNVVCVFNEPQFESSLVKTLIEGTPVRSGMLDPIGNAGTDGPEAYFEMMDGIENGLKKCLLNLSR